MNTRQGFNESVDASTDRRPGVPATQSPEPVGHAHWKEPERQTPRPDLTRDPARPEMSATFGTGQPPHGLSGLIRRLAYRRPDYRSDRWLLLMIGDRIDGFEERISSMIKHPATWILAALSVPVGVAAVLAARRKPRSLSRLF